MLKLCWLLTLILITSNAHSSVIKVGTLSGTVTDAQTGEPVSFVYLHLEEINRTATTDRDGQFRLNNIPAGTFTLKLHRIGYRDQSQTVEIKPDEQKEIELILHPSTLALKTIEVVGSGNTNGLLGSHLEDASVYMTGSELRKNLGTTLSETIANLPGISQRTMGAAPARPVIRGLGDTRVIILQDGEDTGDVSYTSADHAVAIDPVSTSEIEIARGPAALAYGSNAIGGVINVVRNQIPTSKPTSVNGAATLQGTSVNNGISASGNVMFPYRDDFAVNLNLNGRIGQDYKTPLGSVDNSSLQTTNSAAGISYVRPWGHSGLAVSTYLSNYGIPPDSGSGHAEGVDIDMQKLQVDSHSEIVYEDRFLDLLEARISYRFYNHKEYETETIIGTEYTVNTATASLKGRHGEWGVLSEGTIGFQTDFQDYTVYDRFDMQANKYSASLFSIQKTEINNLQAEFGLRFDAHIVHPDSERPDARIGHVRQREFFGLASSAMLVYDLGMGFYGGSSFMYSFRPPTLEELYSEGPHVAAYSFEIGNPDLDAERGLGTELFLRHKSRHAVLETAVYRNSFSNYIYPQNTGRENIFFPNLNDYQYIAVEALMYGFEVSGEFHITDNFAVDGMVEYTFGRREVMDEEPEHANAGESTTPLPMIPPLSTAGGITYAIGTMSFGTQFRYSAAQDRLGEFETPTDAFSLWNAHMQYRFDTDNVMHTFSVKVENILNEEHYNHLSRIKELFPEPGRNFNLLYRVYF